MQHDPYLPTDTIQPPPAHTRNLKPLWLIPATAAALGTVYLAARYPGFASLTVLISLALFCYLAPTVVAFSRRSNQAFAILTVNLLLGWTMIGWVVALAWSLSNITLTRYNL